jgi:hypothetical protein
MCRHKLRLGTERMSVEAGLSDVALQEFTAFDSYVLLYYRLLTYITFNVMDDAAMLSLVFA